MRRRFDLAHGVVVLPALLAIWAGPLHAQLPGDVHWDYRFGHPGVPYDAQATSDGLVASGYFPCVGEHDPHAVEAPPWACNLAIWDGKGWRLEAPAITAGGPLALYQNAPGAIIANTIITTDGTTIEHIAAWTGTEWQTLSGSGGFNGPIHVLAMHDAGLFVGGGFTQAGGIAANGIALWNASGWHALIEGDDYNGVGGAVHAIRTSPQHIVLAGNFTGAGSLPNGTVGLVAQWNLASSTFSRLGSLSGPGNLVLDLERAGSTLIGLTNNQYVPRIYDGAESWDPIPVDPGTFIQHIHVADSGLLYGSGSFPDGTQFGVWDGTTWTSLNAEGGNHGLTGAGEDIYGWSMYGTVAGGRLMQGIGWWNGMEWQPMSRGVGTLSVPDSPPVKALAHTGSALYAAGTFRYAGGHPAHGIARYDGTDWTPLPGPDFALDFRALVADGEGVIAGGHFQSIERVELNGIGRWDGSAWQPLGGGLGYSSGGVFALVRGGNDLYAGGGFATWMGAPANNVARWDGTAWHALGSGIPTTGAIEALAWQDGKLYAGGRLSLTGDNSIRHVAMWDGSAWQVLPGIGTHPFSTVRALAVAGGQLYAAYDQSGPGMTDPSGVYRWTGSEWEIVGLFTVEAYWHSPVPGAVRALYANGDDLYVGGGFTHVNGERTWRIAKWDGATWSGLGSGVWWSGLYGGGEVHAVHGSNEGLWLGGLFSRAGNVPTMNVAQWHDFVLEPTSVDDTAQRPTMELSAPFPNPARGPVTLTLTVSQPQHVRVTAYDVLGRQVALIFDGPVAAGAARELVVGVDHLPSGVYVLRAEGESVAATRRITVLR